jgi:formamidopyrimidine-DNA glycosylase
MPEGPEVKLITNCLNEFVQNNNLREIRINETGKYGLKAPNGYNDFCQHLPLKVKKVNKKGKFMYWEFNKNQYMFNHLMMTGSWSLERDQFVALEFVFTNCILYYSDKRRFGRVEFSGSKADLLKDLSNIGPDMMEPGITGGQFVKIMRQFPKKNFGVAMMEQDKVSGIGNYLRTEILYTAQISPHKKVNELSDQKLKEIFVIAKNILEISYSFKGCSLRDFKNLKGEEGKFQKHLKVYNKKKDQYGYDVKVVKIGGRSVYWVPQVQE